jgi:hypothetical protein
VQHACITRAVDAVGFYEKCGYTVDHAEPQSFVMMKTVREASA